MTEIEEKAYKDIRRELANKDRREYMSNWFAKDLDIIMNLLDNGNKEVNMGIKIKNNVFKINEICYISIENKNNNYIVHIYLNNEVSPIDIIYKSEDEIYKDFLYIILQNNTFYTIDRYDIFNLRYIKSVTLNKINRKDSNNGLQLNILWNNQDLPKIFLFDNIDNIQYNAILADLERKL